MASDTFYIKKGDSAEDLTRTLKDADGNAVDVTSATIVFSMRRDGSKTNTVNRQSVTLVTAASGIVKYVWQAGDTALSGKFIAEFEVTYSGGKIQTFPNNEGDKFYVVVEDDLG